MSSPDRESGFILIGTLWLLILGGSIVAILLSRSTIASRQARDQAVRLQNRWAAESAIQIVSTDVLVRGEGSQWWMLPANGRVRVGQKLVTISARSEAMNLDLNAAEAKTIDDWSRDHRLNSNARARLIQTLESIRRSGSGLSSFAEANALVAQATGGKPPCVFNQMTISSGRAKPANPASGISLSFVDGSATRMSAEIDGLKVTEIIRLGGFRGSAITRLELKWGPGWCLG